MGNKSSKNQQQRVKELARTEAERPSACLGTQHPSSSSLTPASRVAPLPARQHPSSAQPRTVFLQIRVESTIQWGLLPQLMKWVQHQGLTIIDHRTWHDPKKKPRTNGEEDHASTTQQSVVNEIHCRDTVLIPNNQSLDTVVRERIQALEESLKNEIKKPCVVSIQTWSPTAATGATRTNSASRRQRTRSTPVYSRLSLFDEQTGLHRAKIIVDGQSYPVGIDDSSLSILHRGGGDDGDDPTQAIPIYVVPESPLDHLHGLIR